MLFILQRTGGAGIGYHNAIIPEIMGSTYCRLHTHMGLHSADHDLRNGILLKPVQQIRIDKSIDLVFGNDGFTALWPDILMNIPPWFEVMPDMIYRQFAIAELLQYQACIHPCQLRVFQLKPTSGKIEILDID